MTKGKLPNFREAVILAILNSENKYGAQIFREYNEAVPPVLPSARRGGLYLTLARMEKSGLIIPLEDRMPTPGGGNYRKYYKITPNGKKTLATFMDLATKIESLQDPAPGRSLKWKN